MKRWLILSGLSHNGRLDVPPNTQNDKFKLGSLVDYLRELSYFNKILRILY